MINKILSIFLIVIGTLICLFGIAGLFTTLNGKGLTSEDTAFKLGYYSFPFITMAVGGFLIFLGVRIRKNFKSKKLRKDLLNSLPQ